MRRGGEEGVLEQANAMNRRLLLLGKELGSWKKNNIRPWQGRMRFNDHALVIGLVVLAILVSTNNQPIQIVSVVVIAGLVVASMMRQRNNTFAMHLASSDPVNESLVLDCKLADRRMLFMIDTGYAGPPVLSASYLAQDDDSHGSVNARFKAAMTRLEAGVDADAQNRAIDVFLKKSRCFSYTSGCTMRLMGIGSTQEQQADMLMCEMLQIRALNGSFASPKRDTSEAQADVFVTNTLPTSVHIITSDFLLHSSPALLDMSNGALHLNMGANEEYVLRSSMCMHPMVLSGGSFVVTIDVGGSSMRCTVDTGAPGPICLGASAARRIETCSRGGKEVSLRQSGVNGEQVCSDIIRARVSFCKQVFEDAPVFVNDTEVDQVDGYVGMGFLRAFNIMITESGIGFSKNGLSMTSFDMYADHSHSGVCSKASSVKCDA